MQLGAGERKKAHDKPAQSMACLCAESESGGEKGGEDRGEECGRERWDKYGRVRD